MPTPKDLCRDAVANALNELKNTAKIEIADIDGASLVLETPPSPEMGDIGIPMFPFAKTFRMAPPAIAAKIAQLLAADTPSNGGVNGVAGVGEFFAAGPYVNVRLNKASSAAAILSRITREGERYGIFAKNDADAPFAGRRVMVEFSSPNTNKPLHLGHLRNNALGESVSRILGAAGADVFKVNIINDRGVHICKTMLVYQKFHAQGDTPESLGIKSDRFVGNCYVEFGKYAETHAEAEQEAQNLLVAWEKGDAEVRSLWKLMNGWATGGILETYKRTGISFDKFYYESETYLKGREEILKGLADGIFYREEDGSVWVDLAEIGLDKKVLLRKDGTALYMTQDVGTAIFRHADWKFDQLVFVVGSEQQYHFKVLFYILKKLGFQWAENLYHLSYGMVNLPEGRMKTREGTTVDADDLLDSLRDGALAEIAAKGREDAVGDPAAVAESVAIGALHYYLLQTTPVKDMLFNPKESLAFNGNTGPYLQYMGARISSILRKSQDAATSAEKTSAGFTEDSADGVTLLTHDAEWALIKLLEQFPSVIQKSAEHLEPSLLAAYLYDVAKAFGVFYHECPILGAESPKLSAARLNLALCTRTVLKNGMNLILVPFLETM